MNIRNPPMQPPWAQPGAQQPMPQQQPAIPFFSQGQGMPGMPPMQPPTGVMGAPGAGRGISPELLKQIMDTHGMGEEAQRIERQRKMADMLRGSAADQLRGVQVGRRYAAPTALNLGANLLNQYMGSQQEAEADDASKKLGGREGAAMAAYFRRLTGGGQ